MSTQATIQSNLLALGFTNTSQAAFINKVAEGLGVIVDNTLQEFTNTEAAILSIISNQRYGKSSYYTASALAFQYGDNLTQDSNGNPVYSDIDTSKQIIAQAAFENIVSGSTSQLFLKIATTDISGNIIPLSTAQFSAFQAYFNNFEIPGLPVTVISNDANLLSFNAICTYYATYDLATLQSNLTAALTSFRQTFAFDGVFYCGDLEDYIKANVPGVRNFYISNTLIDGVAFSGSTTLGSGYFNYITNILTQILYTGI